jgi:hypothetical protein
MSQKDGGSCARRRACLECGSGLAPSPRYALPSAFQYRFSAQGGEHVAGEIVKIESRARAVETAADDHKLA